MNLLMQEGSTRQTIIRLLKRSGGMTIEELSRQVNITPMGVRQHLLALEKKGIVRYITQKHGIGRPGFVYMLTATADMFFPKTTAQFAIDILKELKETDSPEKFSQVLDARKKRLLLACREALAGTTSRSEALQKIKEVLEADGHIIEISRENGHFHFRNFHCPIREVASTFAEICRHDLALMKELLGPGVTMDQNIIQGDTACRYVISAH
ncbi:MAG: ArsR family transcriptional regulator [Thermodesulfovibrionales bacterium]